MVIQVATELIQAEIKKIYQELEMNRTHAENHRQKAKDFDEINICLEKHKLELLEAMERLK